MFSHDIIRMADKDQTAIRLGGIQVVAGAYSNTSSFQIAQNKLSGASASVTWGGDYAAFTPEVLLSLNEQRRQERPTTVRTNNNSKNE